MKYEYKTIKLQTDIFFIVDTPIAELPELDKIINQLGQNDWELVATEGIIESAFGHNPDTRAIVLFFKRPLAE